MNEARNATLDDLAAILKDQHGRKVDVVAGAGQIQAHGGLLWVNGAEPVIEPDGVTLGVGLYRPTVVCDEGIAAKLGIPVGYLRRMRNERVDLYDANVNGWLRGGPDDHDGDDRSFLIRCFRADDSEVGVARAFLSDRYKVVDNLDVLTAALQGVNDAGVAVDIDGCDLTDRRMYVRIVSPEVQVVAEELLRGYRNPFGDDEIERWRDVADLEGKGYGGEEPIIFAGFVLSNSETGGGAFTITPRAVVKVCHNGLVITKDVMRQVHLGGKLEEGVVEWSEETQQKSVELVRAKTTDAVRTFLSPRYLERAVAGIERAATKPVATVDEVRVLTKSLAFTDRQIDGVLSLFVRGGQMTKGGVVNAITAHAQTIEDADLAYEMETHAMKILT